MRAALLDLAQEVTGRPDPDSAVEEALCAYLRQKIRYYRAIKARLERKYGHSFEEFRRRLGADLPLSWEHERDFLAWEEACTNLAYFEERLRQLTAHDSR